MITKELVSGLDYFSISTSRFEEIVEFYSTVFGSPDYTEDDCVAGWRLGNSWLTFLKGGNVEIQGCEFAIKAISEEAAFELQDKLQAAGATSEGRCVEWMYEDMHYCPVVDPFGLRVLVYYPIEAASD